MKNLPRWIFASVAEHFRVIASDNNIPYFVEGIEERDDDNMQLSHAELRVTGPAVKEISNGYYHVSPTINFLLTSFMDMGGSAYELIQWAGILQEEMLAPIPIYKYGDGPKDTGYLIGCLRVKADNRNKVQVYHFGQMSTTDRVRQSEVDAVYELWTTEAALEFGDLVTEGGPDPDNPLIFLPPTSTMTLVSTADYDQDTTKWTLDTLNLSSNVTRIMEFARPVTQNLGLTSSVTLSTELPRTATTNMSLTQNIVVTQEYSPSSSAMTLVSTATRIMERPRSTTHNMGLTDEVVGAAITPSFKATWNTEEAGTSNSVQVSLPLVSSGSYAMTVNWGDSSDDVITLWTDSAKTHTYNSAGIYEITITGTCNGLQFNYSGDRLKIYNISEWGPFNPNSTSNTFAGCDNLTSNAADDIDLTGVTTTQNMFYGCSVFNGDVSNWDVSNVNTLRGMFRACPVFDQDVGGWDTANVTSLEDTFNGCTVFDQDISTWNTYKVTSMAGTFFGCAAFTSNIGSWNTVNVTELKSMFDGATLFNADISTWNTDKVTTLAHTFEDTSTFNQDIGGWGTANVTDMESVLRNAVAFNQDISTWNTHKVTQFDFFAFGATLFDQDLSSWNTVNCTRLYFMFSNSAANMDVSSWDISGVTIATQMWAGAALDTTNYDLLLIGWDGQAHQNSVQFHAGTTTKYSAGAAATAHANLLGDSWIITDGGPV